MYLCVQMCPLHLTFLVFFLFTLSVSALYRVVWKYSEERMLFHMMDYPEKKYILSFPQMFEVGNTNGRYCYQSKIVETSKLQVKLFISKAL